MRIWEKFVREKRILIPASGLFTLVLVVLFRHYEYRLDAEKRLCLGCDFQDTIRLFDVTRQTQSNYIINFENLTVLCPIARQDCRELKHALPGTQVDIIGTIKPGMIEDSKSTKRLVVSDKINVYSNEVLRPYHLWWWTRVLAQQKENIVNFYGTWLSQPQASLMAGIVLGERATLPPAFTEDLQRTGTMHVVAASGYNLSVVAAATGVVLGQFLQRKAAVALGMGAVGLYALMAGLTPPILRAAVMAGFGYISQMTGRLNQVAWSFLLGILLLLWFSPPLVDSVSFQLSVSATAGILFGTAPIGRVLERVIRGKGVIYTSGRDVLATSLAATLATAPLTLVYFSSVTLSAPLINALIAGFIPLLMGLGVVGVLMALVVPGFGIVWMFLCWPAITLFVKIIEWGSQLPGHVVNLPFNGFLAGGWWCFLAGWWTTDHLDKKGIVANGSVHVTELN